MQAGLGERSLQACEREISRRRNVWRKSFLILIWDHLVQRHLAPVFLFLCVCVCVCCSCVCLPDAFGCFTHRLIFFVSFTPGLRASVFVVIALLCGMLLWRCTQKAPRMSTLCWYKSGFIDVYGSPHFSQPEAKDSSSGCWHLEAEVWTEDPRGVYNCF